MGTFSRHRSYTEKVLLARKRRKTLVRIVLFLIILALVRSFLLQSYLLEDDAMAPSFVKNDRVFVTPLPYGPMFVVSSCLRLHNRRGEMLYLLDRIRAPSKGVYHRFFELFRSHYSLVSSNRPDRGTVLFGRIQIPHYFSIRP